jgi:hypothetical protein
MAETTVTLPEVERHLITARMRQLHAETFGPATSAKTYAEQVDRWLALWEPAKTDGAVRV